MGLRLSGGCRASGEKFRLPRDTIPTKLGAVRNWVVEVQRSQERIMEIAILFQVCRQSALIEARVCGQSSRKLESGIRVRMVSK